MPQPPGRQLTTWSADAVNRAAFAQNVHAPRRATRSRYVKPLLVTIAIVFLYTTITMVGNFLLTVGTLMAFLFTALTVFASGGRPKYLPILAVSIFLPIVIYALHVYFDTLYAIDMSRFGLSFALWCVSMIVIWASFQDRVFISTDWIYPTLVGLTALGVIQYFGAVFFNIWWGYDLVAPLIGFDIFNSYLSLGYTEGIRAIGSYYEPSMFGRVVATLIAISLFQNGKLGPLLVILFINLLTTRSMGLLVLGALVPLIYGAASWRHLGIAAVGLVAGYLVFGDVVASRFAGSGSGATSSTEARLIIPLEAIRQILPSHPFGVPIGANTAVVQNTIVGVYRGFTETKITNGLYEFVLYFGFLAIALIIWLALYTVMSALRGRKTNATIALFILLSTAASSSYLSIESSLLNYILIASLRLAADKKSRTDQLQASLAGLGSQRRGAPVGWQLPNRGPVRRPMPGNRF